MYTEGTISCFEESAARCATMAFETFMRGDSLVSLVASYGLVAQSKVKGKCRLALCGSKKGNGARL